MRPTIVRGGAPLPSWVASFKGDGTWDDQAYGQRPDAALGHHSTYCCFPDCAWLVPASEPACLAHADLVGGLGRVRAVGALTDEFDREMAVDLLRQEMVEAQDARMFG